MLLDLLRDAAVVDFETLGIEVRPDHPPHPVGVAIHVSGEKPRYLAFAHPGGGNTCSWNDAQRQLQKIYASGRPVLMHNAGFDVDVGEVHMGLPRLPWQRYLDTLPALFLLDPRAETYSLKPSAELYLGQKPEERDAVIDWLVQHQPVAGVKISRAKGSPHYAGAYIAFAPPSLVGPYAIGDVTRTRDLAAFAFKNLQSRDMVEPYDRERRLTPILLEMERQGMRVDVRRLQRDVDRYSGVLARLEEWLRKRLRASGDFNLDSGDELADALIAADLAKEEDFPRTPIGKRSTAKDTFETVVRDRQVLASLRYRRQLCTSLRNFMGPWLATARRSNGLIFFSWHSTRRDAGKDSVGARTGRLSSTPNAQNIPKTMLNHFEEVAAPIALPTLPQVRSYIVPYDEGHVLIDRDFSGQELRVMAHFENGPILDAYVKDPDLDLHQFVANETTKILGKEVPRSKAKVISLSLLYGVGISHLAELLGTSTDEARQVKEAYFKAFPSVKDLIDDCTHRWKAKSTIRTWGKREYGPEEPKMINGRYWSFEYKACNVLVQGSSADLTKQALCDYWDVRGETRVLATVHDEILISGPSRTKLQDMERLREVMERDRLDCPIRSEGKMGKTFAECK